MTNSGKQLQLKCGADSFVRIQRQNPRAGCQGKASGHLRSVTWPIGLHHARAGLLCLRNGVISAA